MAHLAAPVTIKRSAHQRLCTPAANHHVTTLEDPIGMVGDNESAAGDDAGAGHITPSILKPTIIERVRHG